MTHEHPAHDHVVENVIPILRVANMRRSLDYYSRVLGFDLDWGGDDEPMASVSRDGHSLMLCEGDQGNSGTWLWIGVHDVMPLYEEIRARGAMIKDEPTNYEWALEMRIEDPDGHVLRFGSEPLPDQPFVSG